MPERTYGEAEIQALLQRAAQLQAAAEDRGRPGLTLGELEQAAAEAGIDPVHLRAAVREAEAGVGLRDVSGQTATHVFAERVVPGTLTDGAWEAVVLRLRERFGSDLAGSFGLGAIYGPGVTETLGSTREWRHTTSLGIATTATLRSADGVQHVRMQQRVGLGSSRVESSGYGLLGALLLAAVVGGAADSVWVFLAVLLTAFAVAAPTIAALDRRWRARKLDDLNAAADEVADIIRDASAEEATEEDARDAASAALPPQPQLLDLDALPDVEDVELHRARSRRTRGAR